ncbi:hypothetical protein UXB74_25360, partial [Escherichia marmotae]|nr:hypothetical protein [Escherichia marmotae]
MPVPDLGVAGGKPGRESMQVFHNPRVLVEPEPKSMCGLPSGVVPADRQSETVIHRYGTGALVLCWHCDNQLRDQTSESLGQLAHQNLSAWMIDVIRHAIGGTQERELSLAELSWWAVRNQVADALPEAVLRRSLGLRAEKIRSVYRESDIIPGEQTATSILKQRTKNLALP